MTLIWYSEVQTMEDMNFHSIRNLLSAVYTKKMQAKLVKGPTRVWMCLFIIVVKSTIPDHFHSIKLVYFDSLALI